MIKELIYHLPTNHLLQFFESMSADYVRLTTFNLCLSKELVY